MKRPSLATFIVGSTPGLLAVVAGCGWMLYYWWTKTNTTSSIQPILAVAFIYAAVRAKLQVVDYRTWERQWDSMDGSTYTRTRSPWLVWVILFGAYIGLGYSLIAYRQFSTESAYQYGAWLFFGLTLVVAFKVFRWKRNRTRRSQSVETEIEFIATPALPMPHQSPHIMQTLTQLPAYSRDLLERTRARNIAEKVRR